MLLLHGSEIVWRIELKSSHYKIENTITTLLNSSRTGERLLIHIHISLWKRGKHVKQGIYIKKLYDVPVMLKCNGKLVLVVC